MKDCTVLYFDGTAYKLERRQTPSLSSVDPVDFSLHASCLIILVMAGGGHNSYKLAGKEVQFRG